MFLNPRSKLFVVWDPLMVLLLFFTAIVTPFEVAYLETKVNALFVLNRAIDLLFACDMGFNFFLPTQVS